MIEGKNIKVSAKSAFLEGYDGKAERAKTLDHPGDPSTPSRPLHILSKLA